MKRLPYYILSVLVVAHVNTTRAQETLVEDYRFGQFVSAFAIDIDPFNNVFISDKGESMVYKFSLDGKQLASVGGQGWDNNQFDEPCGIDASLGVAVYVADYNNHRISRFDKDLNFLGSFSTRDDPNSEASFGYPHDVALSQIGDLFILDGENQRVQYTSGFASVQYSFGGVEAGSGRLNEPIRLTTGTQNNLYVLEANRIIAYDVFGNTISEFGSSQFTDAKSITVYRGIVIVVTPESLLFFKNDGTHLTTIPKTSIIVASEPGEFRDLAVTKTHFLLLTEQYVIVLPNPFNKQ